MERRKAWWGIMLVIAGLLVVGVLPAIGQTINQKDDFESYVNQYGALDQDAAVTAGYAFNGPWRLVDQGEFYGETLNVVPFSGSPVQAVYFGYVNPNTGTGSYDGVDYDDPTFETPAETLSDNCDYVTVSWDYYRQVEYYAQGGYDKTTVVLHFDVGGDVTLFDQDCSNPSVDAWQTVSQEVEVPTNATTAQLIFTFDPVDGYNNDYFGWMVDNILLMCSQHMEMLRWKENTPTNLPQGIEGEKYANPFYNLSNWVEGDGQVRYSLGRLCDRPPCDECDGCVPLLESDPNPLPKRVVLDSGTGHLVGMIEAGSAGNYEFWVRVEKGTKEDPRSYQCICHRFTIAVRSTGTDCFYDDFDGGGTPDASPTWTADWDDVYPLPSCVNLWKTTQTPAVTCGNAPNLDGYGTVAAFTIDSTDSSCGANCTYDTGKRVKGCYISPDITACYPGEITVGFKSWREVEDYPGGHYDKTWVEVSDDGGDTWKKVDALSWDSNNPSPGVWTWEEAPTGIFTTASSDAIKVKFCFDSVDGYGNNHPGWFIDEVTVRVIKSDPYCTFCPLPEAYLGEVYDAELTYNGGVVDRITASGIPDGLEVKYVNSTYRIVGTPRLVPGEQYPATYPIQVSLEQEVPADSGIFKTVGEPCECDLIVNPQRCFFIEDFESDPAWLWGGLWGRRTKTDISAPVDVDGIPIGAGNHVAYFGTTTASTYATGDRSMGLLSLVALPEGIDLASDVQYIELSFDSFRQVEQFSTGYDVTKVQIRWDTGAEWFTVWYKDSGDVNSTGWTRETANNEFAFEKDPNATKMWIRFAFDSVDKWYNDYFGWMVDNIKVCKSDTGKPIDPNIDKAKSLLPRGGNTISVMNVPNPVRDVHTTTFTVRGLGVEAIKIQIFDLNETLVFEQETPGNEMVWHTDNDYGEYLANGIYFYRAYAKIGGMWVQTKFQKLVILR